MHDPSDVIAQLARGPALVAALLADVPPADLRRRPAPARWSAHEHACHLALMEPMWRARLERMVTGENPTIVSYEPDADEVPDAMLAMDLGAALASFARDRDALVAALRALPAAAWARPAVHTAHARYGVFLMCRHVALHDGLHAYRIEESALGSHWPAERARPRHAAGA